MKHCKITHPDFEPYDARLEYSPTPEEYEMGFRYAYSPTAYLARARHRWTNYDEILKCLDDKHDSVQNKLYLAVRDRLNTLIDERMTELGIDFDNMGETELAAQQS